MTASREDVMKLIREMLPPEIVARMPADQDVDPFCNDLNELSINSVFRDIWMRPGLDRRSRSLVTLGILIALRASDELGIHIAIASRNGLSYQEFEEVILQAAGYAGFPAAAAARTVARRTLRDIGVTQSVAASHAR